MPSITRFTVGQFSTFGTLFPFHCWPVLHARGMRGVPMVGVLPGYHGGCTIRVPWWVYTSLVYAPSHHPGYTSLSSHPGTQAATWSSRLHAGREQPGLSPENSYGHEAHSPLPGPKGVTVVILLCALLLRLSWKKGSNDRIEQGETPVKPGRRGTSAQSAPPSGIRSVAQRCADRMLLFVPECAECAQP